MGRSSRSQASANRVRIVEVASGLFRAHGIEAVSISDVMKAAGMTQGGFYKHFASKDALAAEACELAFTKAVGREELAPQITVTRIKNAFYRDFYSPKIIKTHIDAWIQKMDVDGDGGRRDLRMKDKPHQLRRLSIRWSSSSNDWFFGRSWRICTAGI